MKHKSRFQIARRFLIFWTLFIGIGAVAGALAMLYDPSGKLLTLGFSAFSMVMLHLQILQEERYLEDAFDTAYIEYKKQAFRYLGRRTF